MVGGAQPTTKESPDVTVVEYREVSEQALEDEADLNIAFVSGDLAADLNMIEFIFAMEILVAIPAAEGSHIPHPKVVGVGADGVDSGLETDLDLKRQPYKRMIEMGASSVSVHRRISRPREG